MGLTNNATATVEFKWWFIAIDVLMILSSILSILLALIFLLIVLFNKTCHTVPIMLTTNSCFTQILYGSVILSLATFSLENDRQQKVYQDSFCTLRGYLGYVGTGLLLYSLVLEAIYRYIVIVYPTYLSWQSTWTQLFLICFIWMFSFISTLPSLLMNVIQYSFDDQICLVFLRLSFPVIYNMLITYLIPISIIISIYLKLVLYVHFIDSRPTSIARMYRVRRNLFVVRRIITKILILLVLGVPYTIFIIISFFTTPPKYHLRIATCLLVLSQTLIMVAIIFFCRPVSNILMKFLHMTSNYRKCWETVNHNERVCFSRDKNDTSRLETCVVNTNVCTSNERDSFVLKISDA
ncbi:unnamed protein product [Adineta ricciae]|uniref:G-protein coupled receptors family 1 profile domain-containing protein n=1 Tax=Adineta ricciae TaxID=249248 RepID=A0A813Z8X3_ADIRI|nr:unnamed protein product [Adineta ricciae]CAF1429276.1 unnamed protein product [Adineta ricciae]